jgi:phosphatidate cytidylyltransferase
MTGGDEDHAADPGSGRHGETSGGLSAAELIARARAASSGVPERPSRSRRAAEDPVATPAVPERPASRHLTAVEDLDIESVELAPPDSRSRAGRNLPIAIAVGLGLGGLILGTLFSYRPSFVGLVVAAILIGVYEVVKAISTVEARPPLIPLLVGAAAMDVTAWFRGPDGLVGALLLTVLGVAVWRLGDGASGYLRDTASGAFVALYVPFLAGFAVLLAHPDDGAARVVIFILAVVCSDTGGYAAGVLLGKHPMAPTVSPRKSWEGFVGSMLACCACGVIVMHFTFHQQWWKGVLYGFAIVVTATLGDLGESMIKRDLGLKDMGKLLPGHGGIMDRLDSLLPCAAVAYLLLAVFVPA